MQRKTDPTSVPNKDATAALRGTTEHDLRYIQKPTVCTSLFLLLRGTIVNRNCCTHKILYI